MASKNTVNEFVRQRIRELRKSRSIKIREIATRTGLPYSSYASMESGFYNINLDNLFRILGALDVDIREVWPAETVASSLAENELYLQTIQQFRLGELVSLCDAEGGGTIQCQWEQMPGATPPGSQRFPAGSIDFLRRGWAGIRAWPMV